jgi:hypothetical protein
MYPFYRMYHASLRKFLNSRNMDSAAMASSSSHTTLVELPMANIRSSRSHRRPPQHFRRDQSPDCNNNLFDRSRRLISLRWPTNLLFIRQVAHHPPKAFHRLLLARPNRHLFNRPSKSVFLFLYISICQQNATYTFSANPEIGGLLGGQEVHQICLQRFGLRGPEDRH